MANVVLQKKDGKTIHYINADFTEVSDRIVVTQNITDDMVGGYAPVKVMYYKGDLESVKTVEA